MGRTNAMRCIEVTQEARIKLIRAFRCTAKTVQESLKYRMDSDTARKIRYVAVKEYGGKPMLYVPECETLFTTELDGKEYMRQTFNNGAVLLWHKGTPDVIVRFQDKEEAFKCDSLPRFTEIQIYAENL